MLARIGPKGYATERYRAGDFSVEIQQAAGQTYVRIVASGSGIYEFGAGGFDEYTQGFVDVSGVRMYATKKPSPLFSMTFPSPVPPDLPRWRDVSPGYFFRRDRTETSFFNDFLSYQPQGVNEAAWWKGNSVKGVVHSAWGMPQGRMNTAGFNDALHSDGGTKMQPTFYSFDRSFTNAGNLITTYNTDYFTGSSAPVGLNMRTPDEAGTTAVPQFDRLFDIPPVYYPVAGPVLGGVGPYVDDYTWYRHAAIITSDLGNLFFVLADSKGGFLFYRAKGYWSDATVLGALVDQPGFPGVKAPASTAIAYQRVVPTYPAWVTLPVDGEATPLQWWNWQFNKDATKAATVALNSAARAKWFHHTASDDPNKSQNPAWWEDWFVDPLSVSGSDSWLLFDQATKGTACRKDLPGLVEVSIGLTETGPGDLDFSASVSVVQSDYFGDTGTFWVDAGYAFPGLSVAEDSLITAEIECYRGRERWYHVWHDMGGFSDGAVDGSDYAGNLKRMDIDRFGSSWVVKSGGVELAREVLQHAKQIDSWLPEFTPGSDNHVLGGWTLNNAGAYGFGDKIARYGASGGLQIARAKGMFTAGAMTYGEGTSWDHDVSATSYDAEIVAADLRSLSYVVRQQTTSGPDVGPFDRTLQHKLVAFGVMQALPSAGRTMHFTIHSGTGWIDSSDEMVYTSTTINMLQPYAPFTMPDKPADQFPMDKVLHEQMFTVVALSRLPCYTHHEIRSTPAGDWSVWVNDADVGTVDIIAPAKGVRTSHTEQFNKAFGMSLPSGYYGDSSSATGYRDTGGFGLSRNWLPRIS